MGELCSELIRRPGCALYLAIWRCDLNVGTSDTAIVKSKIPSLTFQVTTNYLGCCFNCIVVEVFILF